MTKSFALGLGLASILSFSMMENGSYGLCFADDGGGDTGGDASGGGSTALTASTPAADADAPKIPSLGEAMYGEGDGKPGEKKDGEQEGKDGAAEWKEYEPDASKTDEENAAAKAEHDKTKPADDDKGKEEDEPQPIKAEEYEFVDVPEGFELDPAVDKEFREFASKRNWSKDDVKELTSLQVKLYERQSEAHAERVAEWGEGLKTDKEIGGRAYDANMAKAREAKQAFFPPEVNDILDKTGLGNHPAIVKGFVRIGKAMGEIGTLHGKGGASSTTILENLYGSE